MIDNLKDAIEHATQVARNLKAEAKAWQGCAIQSKGKVKANECLECASDHEQLVSWLTELQERREADKWIPVSERMPECNGNYLAITNYGTRIVHFSRDKDRPYSIQFDTLEKVYYWRPLPKAPESEASK